MFGKKDKIISELQQRVTTLEFLICQGKHDYVPIKKTENIIYGAPVVDIEYEVRYKCKNCHKEVLRIEN